MQSNRLPAAPVVAALLAVALLGLPVVGCKARTVDPDSNGTNNGDPDNGTNHGTPDPELLAQVRQLQEDKETLSTENDNLRQQLDDARSDLDELNTEVNTLRAQRQTLQTSNADLDARLRSLEGEKNDLMVKIQELEAELANLSTEPDPGPDPDPIEPGPATGRPELAEGWARHDMEAGFGFDYPEGWTVEADHGIEANEYTLAGPNGEQMRVTVWAYLKSEPDVLAGDTWTARLQELEGMDITPTTEVELQEIENGIAGDKSFHCQLLFDKDGQTWRHRITAAALAAGDEMFGAWYTVLVEYTWDATNDDSLATYEQVIGTFYVE